LILMALLATSLTGCTRWSMNSHLNDAYRAYDQGDCARVMLRLSQVERESRSRPYVQPEVSLLRGQCLEREKLFVDAVQTYQFIATQYPYSEYAYRARARLDTLQQLGHVRAGDAAQPYAVPH
jgi:outer membrane protein assembly factor BamD (BamD/ComL family)